MRRYLALLFTLALALGARATIAAPGKYEIQLLGKRWTPQPGIAADLRQSIDSAAGDLRAARQQKIHLLVQLNDIPAEGERFNLASQGLELGAYVPGNAWIASVPLSDLSSVLARRDLRFAMHWNAERKLHPRLQRGEVGDWARDPSRPGWVMTMVQLHQDVDISRLYSIANEVGGVVMDPIDGIHGATMWVEAERLAKLAGIEDVLWIEEGAMPLSPTNDGVRAQMRVNDVNAAPYNLTGTGVRAFVFDGGSVRTTHETFNAGAGSRVTVIDGSAAADHATHVAGTVGGDGLPTSAGGRARGVAPGVSFLSATYSQAGGTMLFWDNAGDLQADYSLARNTHNADLGTNSIGSNTANNGYPCDREGDYGVTSNLLDGIARGDNATVGSPVILTWANGNERTGGSPRGRCGGNYVTTAPPSCAKNPIHVGAINSDGGSMTRFSSWGPCDDGRMKPVVSAPGCESGRVTGETSVFSSLNTSDTAYGGFCGTSMATPAVAGAVSLLIQDWRAQTGAGANARPMPALVKTLLVHSATDLGQDGPDYIYGYGAVNAKALIDLLRADNGVLGDGGTTAWGTDSATNGSVDSFTINVPAGTGVLKATLAWDDPAAAAFSATAYVNNLTLELVAPDASVRQAFILDPANPHLPATTGNNLRDNQEQVLVKNPAAGIWTVRVTGTSVPTGPQSYALAYSATPASHDAGACSAASNSTYEAGNDGWTLSGAARVAAPAAGHGSFSLRLGGAVSTTHEATLDVAIPAGVGKAEWTYWWYMTTAEAAATGFNLDDFFAEVRNTSGTVLAAVDLRTDAWRQNTWMQQQNIDLTPWAGTTVRLAFRAVNNATRATSFFVDDVNVTTCPAVGGCTPPAAPTGLTANAVSQTQINLSWTGSGGATSYNILRSTTSGGPYALVGTSATTSFSNTGLSCNTAYFYVVQASNGTCASGNSTQATATTNACSGCTTQTLYNHGFEPPATGLDGFAAGTFLSGGSTADWRGVQTCTAAAGGNIFRFGGTTCTADYTNNTFSYAQPNGTGGITIPTGATTARLTFAHRRAFESGFDGGTLRISTNGTSYTNVPASAILAGAYNGTVAASCAPAGSAGLAVWTGNSTTFTTTTVDLDAACNAIPGNVGGCAGKAVRIAFTTVTDCSVVGDGWFLDDVSVQACVP